MKFIVCRKIENIKLFLESLLLSLTCFRLGKDCWFLQSIGRFYKLITFHHVSRSGEKSYTKNLLKFTKVQTKAVGGGN